MVYSGQLQSTETNVQMQYIDFSLTTPEVIFFDTYCICII